MTPATPATPAPELVYIGVRIDAATADRFRAAAEADKRNVSSLLRVLIDAETERHEQATAVAGSSDE